MDATDVFQFPAELNERIEELFQAFKNGGAVDVVGPKGYSYNFENMFQTKGFAVRTLKREGSLATANSASADDASSTPAKQAEQAEDALEKEEAIDDVNVCLVEIPILLKPIDPFRNDRVNKHGFFNGGNYKYYFSGDSLEDVYSDIRSHLNWKNSNKLTMYLQLLSQKFLSYQF